MALLSQNKELRPHLIWNWSIPALTAKLSDGRRISTCPSAGICARFCYARNGTYLFRNVLAAHTKHLEMIINDPEQWVLEMNQELKQTKFTKKRSPRQIPIDLSEVSDTWLRAWIDRGSPAIRIHDSGDFFADWYLNLWIRITQENPDLLFYAYTKEITMLSKADLPINFRWLASTGGTQDHLITDEIRHAEVFPNTKELQDAGYSDQSANDLLCILLPNKRIGIPANNIPHFNKQMRGKTFGAIQASLHPQVAATSQPIQ